MSDNKPVNKPTSGRPITVTITLQTFNRHNYCHARTYNYRANLAETNLLTELTGVIKSTLKDLNVDLIKEKQIIGTEKKLCVDIEITHN